MKTFIRTIPFLFLFTAALQASEVTLSDPVFRKKVVACAEKIFSNWRDPSMSFNSNLSLAYLHEVSPGSSTPHSEMPTHRAFLIYSPEPKAVCLLNAQDFFGTYLLIEEKMHVSSTYPRGATKSLSIPAHVWFLKDPFPDEEDSSPVIEFAIINKTTSTEKKELRVEGDSVSNFLVGRADDSKDALCLPALRSALTRMTQNKILPVCESVKSQLDRH